jgi:rhodanese-related sulfurtransferase
MRPVRYFSILVLVFLIGCLVPAPSETVYTKITPLEAQKMMDTVEADQLIVLDVRNQEEFDEGQVRNAVLLPVNEIQEKAPGILPDKNQVILVYCKAGSRSETAAKQLIEMGYTRVFDFGGIGAWTGEITVKDSDIAFYNFFGGALPEDVVTPIDYLVQQRIHSEMPEFEFRIQGENTKVYSLNHDQSKYYIAYETNRIGTINIKDDRGAAIQEIVDLETETPNIEGNDYGFSLADWNFDGYLDMSLWQYPGGSMGNNPTYFWLWDQEQGEFIENTKLQEMSDYSHVSISDQNRQIESYFRAGFIENMTSYYEYQKNQYVLVKSRHVQLESAAENSDDWVARIVIEELIDGQMIVTADYYDEVN